MSFVCCFFQACYASVFVTLVQKKQLFSCGDFQFQEAEAENFVFVLWNGNNIKEESREYTGKCTCK